MGHIITFGRQYSDVEEYEIRRSIFEENDAFINLHNSSNASFTLGHNQFSDMTEGEKKNTRGLLSPEYLTAMEPVILDASQNADSIDWRAKGVVNEIQDQGNCGSCWAFSTMASVESEHAIKTGKLLKFAEQQLVDCSTLNHGCNGGSMSLAFLYLKTHAAILEADYPYKGVGGTCQYDSLKNTGVDTTGMGTNVQTDSVDQLKAALNQGVVSVAIEADKAVFQLYKSGVFDSDLCGTTLDHGVALVGYGNENGQDYYILRNSWNTTWGDNGYMKIAAVDGQGICGVQMAPVYPTTN